MGGESGSSRQIFTHVFFTASTVTSFTPPGGTVGVAGGGVPAGTRRGVAGSARRISWPGAGAGIGAVGDVFCGATCAVGAIGTAGMTGVAADCPGPPGCAPVDGTETTVGAGWVDSSGAPFARGVAVAD